MVVTIGEAVIQVVQILQKCPERLEQQYGRFL